MIIRVLLVIMAILTILSGLATFFGSRHQQRVKNFWHLLATIGGSGWAFFLARFLALDPSRSELAPFIVATYYISGMIMILGLFGYNCWNRSSGRALTVLLSTFVAFFAGAICCCPQLLYSSISITGDYNSIAIVTNTPFYYIYVAYYIVAILIFSLYKIADIRADRAKGRRITGDISYLIGVACTGVFSFAFNLILPIWDYSLVWIGPIAMCSFVIGFYYYLLKKRLTTISTRWMMGLSYAIIAAVASMIYLVIFYGIFTALFHGQEPSTQVVILNFIMFLVIILGMPVLREISSSLISLVSINKVDMSYVIKKLNQLAPKSKNYHEIATFLAEHLHFDYLGFIIDGQIYGSEPLNIEKGEIEKIMSIPINKKLWQIPSESTQLILNKYNINAVAPLDSNKRQILIGRPVGRQNLKKSDLADIETIINLIAAIL